MFKKGLLFLFALFLGASTAVFAADMDEFELDISPSNVDVEDKIDLEIVPKDKDNEVVKDYDEDIIIKVEVREDGDWEDADDSMFEFDDDGDCDEDLECEIDLDGANKYEIEDFIRFLKPGDYRITVEEDGDEDINGDIRFEVEGDAVESDSDAEKFVIRASDSKPSVNDRVSIRLSPMDKMGDEVAHYAERIKFNVYQYVDGKWEDTDESDYELAETTYTVSMDTKTYDEIEDIIKIKTDGKFKLEVYERADDSINGEVILIVGNYSGSDDDDDSSTSSSSSSSDDLSFTIVTNPTDPGVDQATSLHVTAQGGSNEPTGELKFVVYQKNDDGLYAVADSSSYTLSDANPEASFGNGDKNVYVDIITFKERGQYEIIVQDKANEKAEGKVRFYVDSRAGEKEDEKATSLSDFASSSDDDEEDEEEEEDTEEEEEKEPVLANGFTQKEMDKVKKYKLIRNKLLQILKKKFPGIKNDNIWDMKQELLLQDMEDILAERTYAKHKNFDDFYADLKAFVKYSVVKGRK